MTIFPYMPRRLARLATLIREVLSMPKVSVRMFGDDSARLMYRHFVTPHRLLFVIARKSWGAALLRIPDDFGAYLRGSKRQVVRTNRNRALAAGFRACVVDPATYVNDMLEIAHSAPERQGRPMDARYLDRNATLEFFRDRGPVLGVLNASGSLRAYVMLVYCGEVCVLNRLLGHRDDLEQGVMYLLVSEAIREMTARRSTHGVPLWAMYDTMLGAPQGLRYFKERLGFSAHRAKWIWGKK